MRYGPPRPPARDHRTEFVGLVGFAFFLIIVGIVFYLNPNLLQQIVTWFEDMTTARSLLRPPEDLIRSATLFWLFIGGTNFIIAVLRWGVIGSKLRTLGAALGGVGMIAFAYLLWLYSNRTISGQLVMSYEAAAIGLLLIGYVSFGLYWSSTRRRAAVPAAHRPTARP